MESALHPIKVAVEKSGVSAHVIRIWEKRYGAAKPARTPTNRRLYSDDQVERLRLLWRLTERGHSIGCVARLGLEELRGLLGGSTVPESPAQAGASSEEFTAGALKDAVAAVEQMNSELLGTVLRQAELRLGAQGVLQRVVAPLAQTIGDLWRTGSITSGHEHFASSVLRLFLGQAARPFAATPGAPVIIVATPAGQLHELGALLAGAAAANLGWRVVYLGAGLGAAEIAGAVRQNGASALALSIVYPEDDPGLTAELVKLRNLAPGVAIMAGGRAVPVYRQILEQIGAQMPADLARFGVSLDLIRRKAPGSVGQKPAGRPDGGNFRRGAERPDGTA